MKQIKIGSPKFKRDGSFPIIRRRFKGWVNVVKYHGKKHYAPTWFKNKLNHIEMKEDKKKYPNKYFFIDNKVVMEYSEKDGWLLAVGANKIRSFIHWEFGYNHQSAENLVRNLVEDYFKIILSGAWTMKSDKTILNVRRNGAFESYRNDVRERILLEKYFKNNKL